MRASSYRNAFDEAYYERTNRSVAHACHAMQALLAASKPLEATFSALARAEQVAAIYAVSDALGG